MGGSQSVRSVVLFSLYPGLVCGLEVGRSVTKKEAIVDSALCPLFLVFLLRPFKAVRKWRRPTALLFKSFLFFATESGRFEFEWRRRSEFVNCELKMQLDKWCS